MGKIVHPADLINEFLALRSEVRALAKRVGLSSAVISRGGLKVTDGGNITIDSPGRLELRYEGGNILGYLGPVYQFGEKVSDGLYLASGTEFMDGSGAGVNIFQAAETPTGMSVNIGSGTSYPVDAFRTYAKQTFIFAGSDAGIGTLELRADSNILLNTPATTTTGVNVRVDPSNKRVLIIGSSRATKLDIEDLDVDLNAVLAMRPRTWRDRAEVEADPTVTARYVGFIAEELDELGLGQFVEYDEDGRPRSIVYDRLFAVAIPMFRLLKASLDAVQADLADVRAELAETRAENAALRADMAALTARLDALEAR